MANPLVPNFKPGVGRLATDRYDFENHIDGADFRHNATQIDLFPTVVINGDGYTTVQQAINALANVLIVPTIAAATTTTLGLVKLAGDITGTDGNSITVSGLRGRSIVNVAPTTNQVLGFNGTNWTPTTLAPGWAGPTVASVFTIPIATHTYSVSNTDLFIFLNPGIVAPQTIILPAPTAGRSLIIKATTAISLGNVLTVVPHGSETIEGLPNITTTVSALSNGVTLNSGTTINVASTTGFPSSGTIYVVSTTGTQPIIYGSTTPTSFIPTGASSPTGVINTGNSVNASTYLYVTDFGTLRLVCDSVNWWIW